MKLLLLANLDASRKSAGAGRGLLHPPVDLFHNTPKFNSVAFLQIGAATGKLKKFIIEPFVAHQQVKTATSTWREGPGPVQDFTEWGMRSQQVGGGFLCWAIEDAAEEIRNQYFGPDITRGRGRENVFLSGVKPMICLYHSCRCI